MCRLELGGSSDQDGQLEREKATDQLAAPQLSSVEIRILPGMALKLLKGLAGAKQ